MDTTSNFETILIIGIGTLGMVILALGIVFFFLTYQKRLQKQQLQLSRVKAEQQKQLLENTVVSQEKERKRFAADLHDEVGALLSVIKMNLGRIEKKQEEDKLKVLAGETKNYLDDVISQVRRITRDLSPPTLEKFGLVHAMNEFINKATGAQQMNIYFWTSGGQPRFESKLEIAAFRIFQELINNAIKYSQASEVAVKIKYDKENLYLSVCDNGVGFDIKKAEASGLGLKNLESRVGILRGKYKIRSAPGKGTTFILATKIKVL